MSNLTGVTFAYNAILQDYCLAESVASLKEFCDEVIVLDAGSMDGTSELIKTFQDKQTRVILCDNEEWKSQQGKEKLSYFTNKALKEVNTEWQYYQQADEITHEASYPFIRNAMTGNANGYLVSRVNLWGSPYFQLNVPLERMPCSPEVIRLTKRGYMAYDDAENLGCMAAGDYIHNIRMYHMGFVREKKAHRAKIIHMQKEVFQFADYDQKLNQCETFDPKLWFSDNDLIPIGEPLPALIQQWAKERE